MTVFYTWPFPASKGSYAGTDTRVSRTLPIRLSEVVNVKDWGALGDASTNDYSALQAAIDFCIAQGGGKVFFPPGQYKCLTALVIGTDDITKQYNFVQLIGSGGQGNSNTVISGLVSGWVLSKGSKAYDLLQKVEGIRLSGGNGSIKITGTGVEIRSCSFGECLVMVDASQATGATIMDCTGSGGDITSADASGPTVFSSSGVGVYLGNNCMAVNCRLMGSNWITYALSGTGASLVGCSTEVTYTAVRLGWAPDSNALVFGGGRELAAVGCTVTGMQTERQVVTLDLFNAVGCLIMGNSFTSGHGVPTPQAITNLVFSAGTVTATTTAAHNLPSGDSVLELDFQGHVEPTYWRPNSFTTCHNASSTTFTYTCPDPGFPFSGSISAMSWNGTTHVVTVTVGTTGTAIPVGTTLKLSGMSATFAPDGVTLPFNVVTTSDTSNATHFSYAGPSSAPSGTQTGTWDMSPGVAWSWPVLFGIRCRKVRETLIVGNYVTANASLASVDLVYGTVPSPYNATTAGEAIHSNNMIINLIGDRGWYPPTNENAAGWKFVNCGISALRTFANPSASLSPGGTLTFAYLPGQFTNTANQWQAGPFEGQEYDIGDGSKFGFTPPTAAASGDQIIGGGNGKYRVRYDGTVWRRLG